MVLEAANPIWLLSDTVLQAKSYGAAVTKIPASLTGEIVDLSTISDPATQFGAANSVWEQHHRP